ASRSRPAAHEGWSGRHPASRPRPSSGTALRLRLREPHPFFWARLVQRLLEDLDLERLAAELPFQLADPLLQLTDSSIAGHVVFFGRSHASSFQHQTPPTIQQVLVNILPAGNDRNASAFLQCLLDIPQLLGG